MEQVEIKEPNGWCDFNLIVYTSLIKNLSAGNKGGVMESLQKLVNYKQFSIDSFKFKDALKQSAILLLSTDVFELLEKSLLVEWQLFSRYESFYERCLLIRQCARYQPADTCV